MRITAPNVSVEPNSSGKIDIDIDDYDLEEVLRELISEGSVDDIIEAIGISEIFDEIEDQKIVEWLGIQGFLDNIDVGEILNTIGKDVCLAHFKVEASTEE